MAKKSVGSSSVTPKKNLTPKVLFKKVKSPNKSIKKKCLKTPFNKIKENIAKKTNESNRTGLITELNNVGDENQVEVSKEKKKKPPGNITKERKTKITAEDKCKKQKKVSSLHAKTKNVNLKKGADKSASIVHLGNKKPDKPKKPSKKESSLKQEQTKVKNVKNGATKSVHIENLGKKKPDEPIKKTPKKAVSKLDKCPKKMTKKSDKTKPTSRKNNRKETGVPPTGKSGTRVEESKMMSPAPELTTLNDTVDETLSELSSQQLKVAVIHSDPVPNSLIMTSPASLPEQLSESIVAVVHSDPVPNSLIMTSPASLPEQLSESIAPDELEDGSRSSSPPCNNVNYSNLEALLELDDLFEDSDSEHDSETEASKGENIKNDGISGDLNNEHEPNPNLNKEDNEKNNDTNGDSNSEPEAQIDQSKEENNKNDNAGRGDPDSEPESNIDPSEEEDDESGGSSLSGSFQEEATELDPESLCASEETKYLNDVDNNNATNKYKASKDLSNMNSQGNEFHNEGLLINTQGKSKLSMSEITDEDSSQIQEEISQMKIGDEILPDEDCISFITPEEENHKISIVEDDLWMSSSASQCSLQSPLSSVDGLYEENKCKISQNNTTAALPSSLPTKRKKDLESVADETNKRKYRWDGSSNSSNDLSSTESVDHSRKSKKRTFQESSQDDTGKIKRLKKNHDFIDSRSLSLERTSESLEVPPQYHNGFESPRSTRTERSPGLSLSPCRIVVERLEEKQQGLKKREQKNCSPNIILKDCSVKLTKIDCDLKEMETSLSSAVNSVQSNKIGCDKNNSSPTSSSKVNNSSDASSPKKCTMKTSSNKNNCSHISNKDMDPAEKMLRVSGTNVQENVKLSSKGNKQLATYSRRVVNSSARVSGSESSTQKVVKTYSQGVSEKKQIKSLDIKGSSTKSDLRVLHLPELSHQGSSVTAQVNMLESADKEKIPKLAREDLIKQMDESLEKTSQTEKNKIKELSPDTNQRGTDLLVVNNKLPIPKRKVVINSNAKKIEPPTEPSFKQPQVFPPKKVRNTISFKNDEISGKHQSFSAKINKPQVLQTYKKTIQKITWEEPEQYSDNSMAALPPCDGRSIQDDDDCASVMSLQVDPELEQFLNDRLELSESTKKETSGKNTMVFPRNSSETFWKSNTTLKNNSPIKNCGAAPGTSFEKRDCHIELPKKDTLYENPNLEPEDMRKIFINSLGNFTTEETLKTYFERWGVVISSVVKKRHYSKGPQSCFGFVTFAHSEMAKNAVIHQIHEIDGRDVEVKQYFPKNVVEERESEELLPRSRSNSSQSSSNLNEYNNVPFENILQGTAFDGYCLYFLRNSTDKTKTSHQCNLKHEVPKVLFRILQTEQNELQSVLEGIRRVCKEDCSNPPLPLLGGIIEFCIKNGRRHILTDVVNSLKRSITVNKVGCQNYIVIWNYFSKILVEAIVHSIPNPSSLINFFLQKIIYDEIADNNDTNLKVLYFTLGHLSNMKNTPSLRLLQCVEFLSKKQLATLYPHSFVEAVLYQVIERANVSSDVSVHNFVYKVYRTFFNSLDDRRCLYKENRDLVVQFFEIAIVLATNSKFGHELKTGLIELQREDELVREQSEPRRCKIWQLSPKHDTRQPDNTRFSQHNGPDASTSRTRFVEEMTPKEVFDIYKSKGTQNYLETLQTWEDSTKKRLNDVTMSFILLESEKGDSWNDCYLLVKEMQEYDPYTVKDFINKKYTSARRLFVLIQCFVKSNHIEEAVDWFLRFNLNQTDHSNWLLPTVPEDEDLWSKFTETVACCLSYIMEDQNSLREPVCLLSGLNYFITRAANFRDQGGWNAMVTIVTTMMKENNKKLLRQMTLDTIEQYRILIRAICDADNLENTQKFNHCARLMKKSNRDSDLFPADSWARDCHTITVNTCLTVEEMYVFFGFKIKIFTDIHLKSLHILFQEYHINPKEWKQSSFKNISTSVEQAIHRFKIAYENLGGSLSSLIEKGNVIILDKVVLCDLRKDITT